MNKHLTRRPVAILALTALFFIPLRAAAQSEVEAWTTNDGTTFWAQLVGRNGTDLILMAGNKDFRVPVSRLSARSLGKAAQTLGLTEKMLESSDTPPSASRKPEAAKPLTDDGQPGPARPKCRAAAPAAAKRNSCVRPTAGVIRPQTDDGPVAVESEDESTGVSNRPDLGTDIVEFCKAHIGVKVGNGQCTTLATEAMAAAGAKRMGRDFPRRGDYVWGEQLALLEHERGGIAGLESLTKARPGDVIQFRNVRLAGRTPGGATYGMNASHHTAVVASVDPAAAVLTIYHQNWGRMIVKQDRMHLNDLQSGWLRIYRPITAE